MREPRDLPEYDPYEDGGEDTSRGKNIPRGLEDHTTEQERSGDAMKEDNYGYSRDYGEEVSEDEQLVNRDDYRLPPPERSVRYTSHFERYPQQTQEDNPYGNPQEDGLEDNLEDYSDKYKGYTSRATPDLSKYSTSYRAQDDAGESNWPDFLKTREVQIFYSLLSMIVAWTTGVGIVLPAYYLFYLDKKVEKDTAAKVINWVAFIVPIAVLFFYVLLLLIALVAVDAG